MSPHHFLHHNIEMWSNFLGFFFLDFQSPVLSHCIEVTFIRVKLGSTPGNDSYFAHKKLTDDMLILNSFVYIPKFLILFNK